MYDTHIAKLKAQLAQIEAQQAQTAQAAQSMSSPYSMPSNNVEARIGKLENQVGQLVQAAQLLLHKAPEAATVKDDAKAMFAALGGAFVEKHQVAISHNKEKFYAFLSSDPGKAAAMLMGEAFEEYLKTA